MAVKRFAFCCLLSCAILYCNEGFDVAKKAHAHLLIHDPYSAVQVAKKGLEAYPTSKPLWYAYVEALCKQGDEIEALKAWKEACRFFDECVPDRFLLETLAWGVLRQGEHSTQLPIMVNSLIGASFTRDAQAIPILLRHLRSSSALLRSVAIHLSAQFGDQTLRDELLRLLKEERVWYVRLEAIKAVGQMQMEEARGVLEEILAQPKLLAEEKAEALIALVQMYDEIEREKLLSLIHSNRAGLRELACQILIHLDEESNVPLILPLLKDPNPEVRLSVVVALGLMHHISSPLLRERLKDSSPPVAIAAAWALLSNGEIRAEKALRKWISQDEPEWQRLASAALARSGQYGMEASYKILKKTKDPYVRVNLALGLIGQRKETEYAAGVLSEVMHERPEGTLWMWDHQPHPLFKSLAPSQVRHVDYIPHYPQVIHQMTCLDLLSALTIVRHPQAQEEVKLFLKQRAGSVSSAAATALLEEGDERAFELVRSLLSDKDPDIRFQAAYILALQGGDLEALNVLIEAYTRVDREKKVSILEAIAHVGDPKTIPFLMDVLHDPFQVLRVVAASALIQCLYH